ncbi:hypothetical protein PPACK8108_LOCUS19566 [Phakopsora pachyrhizi]|uniref:Adenosine deaminase domain-containing protein n=1 Tax=Phakopsora pachyrhizi TaxID=170000 RepID=A0AAV0BD34_PHAPC|nr:hypothetical protein PPACK8108_LOCUS19566 [Phakopsora pachyrhizi]
MAHNAFIKNDLEFCISLPKIECHAHLSGSIPLQTLKELHEDALRRNPELELKKFFDLFNNHIYKVIDTPEALTVATKSVLDYFEGDNCFYLELRTTPREFNKGNGIEAYIDALYRAFEAKTYQTMKVSLILSVNWDSSFINVRNLVDMALGLRDRNPPVVGIDVCGNPLRSELYQLIAPELKRAKSEGLKLTIHFAEVKTSKELLENQLRSLNPDRLGHATHSKEVEELIIDRNLPIECCFTSNLKSNTVESLEKHHFNWAIEKGLPVLISTDDTLFFGSNLSEEYNLALRLLGGDRKRLISVLEKGIDHIFGSELDKIKLKESLKTFKLHQGL